MGHRGNRPFWVGRGLLKILQSGSKVLLFFYFSGFIGEKHDFLAFYSILFANLVEISLYKAFKRTKRRVYAQAIILQSGSLFKIWGDHPYHTSRPEPPRAKKYLSQKQTCGKRYLS